MRAAPIATTIVARALPAHGRAAVPIIVIVAARRLALLSERWHPLRPVATTAIATILTAIPAVTIVTTATVITRIARRRIALWIAATRVRATVLGSTTRRVAQIAWSARVIQWVGTGRIMFLARRRVVVESRLAIVRPRAVAPTPVPAATRLAIARPSSFRLAVCVVLLRIVAVIMAGTRPTTVGPAPARSRIIPAIVGARRPSARGTPTTMPILPILRRIRGAVGRFVVGWPIITRAPRPIARG